MAKDQDFKLTYTKTVGIVEHKVEITVSGIPDHSMIFLEPHLHKALEEIKSVINAARVEDPLDVLKQGEVKHG